MTQLIWPAIMLSVGLIGGAAFGILAGVRWGKKLALFEIDRMISRGELRVTAGTRMMSGVIKPTAHSGS